MVSIIVPIYNNSRTIERCINSFLAQTYKEFEIILIDDGSSPSNARLYDELANRNEKVFVYHYANEGVSAARNHGIEHAKGNYIFFADSDDYAEANMLAFFMKIHNTYTVDMIVAGYYYDIATSSDKISYLRQFVEEMYLKNRKEILHNMIYLWDKSMMYNIWNKLFVAKIIKDNNIKFPVGKEFNEDRDFVREYVMHTRSMYITEEAFYHYTKENQDTLTAQYRVDMLDIRKEELNRLNSFFYELGIYDEAKEYIAREHFERMVGTVENTLYSKVLNRRNIKAEINKILIDEKTQWAIKNAKPKSKKMKIIHWVFRLGNVEVVYFMMYIIFQIKQKNAAIFYRMRQSR